MKKGLLLSIAASAFIFAGGDIAPVEPAAPASADFWGQIGFRYDANDVDGGYDLGDRQNNAFSSTIILGVEKELGYGFGFGAELAGWTDFGLNIADNPAVVSADQTNAEVSQAYLTYSTGNTAVKLGRQALPKAVSPWAWSDRTTGVLDYAYDAVVIANTDLENTTLVGAWVSNAVNEDDVFQIGAGHTGVFMLAAVNKSLANTTLTVTGYYIPKWNIKHDGLPYNDYLVPKAKDMWSVWGSSMTQLENGWHLGLQGAYVDGDFTNYDATYGVAAKLGSSWGNLSADFIAAYINDGDYSLKTAGTGLGTSAFWGNSFGGFFTNGDIVSDDQSIVRVDAEYKLNYGKVFGGLAYVTYGDKYIYDDGYGFRAGYKFPLFNNKVNANIEYRYATYNGQNGNPDFTKQRVRVEAYYKF